MRKRDKSLRNSGRKPTVIKPQVLHVGDKKDIDGVRMAVKEINRKGVVFKKGNTTLQVSNKDLYKL